MITGTPRSHPIKYLPISIILYLKGVARMYTLPMKKAIVHL